MRVLPGDAASSYLVDKLRGTGCGAPRPIGVPLADDTIDCGDVLVPGDPASSVLIGKLDGTELCNGSLMPKGNGALSAHEIDPIATWVCQGAASYSPSRLLRVRTCRLSTHATEPIRSPGGSAGERDSPWGT